VFRTLLGVVLACALAGPAHAAIDVDSLLAAATANRTVPGIAVLVIRDGHIAEQAVRGVRASDAPDSAKLTDVWHLGSDAKPMTATLIARLVERGVLAWNTPLSKLLPELATAMRPEYRSVTLVQLLSHTAGLPSEYEGESLDTLWADQRPLPAQRLSFARRVLQDPPVVPRGTFRYSNASFIIAAAVAEHATKKSYEQLMRQEVFQPLGITTAQFGPTHRGQPLGHENGKPLTGYKADNPLVYAPAGGIAMSMHDWAKFAIDHMAGEQGGGKLLKRETYAYLHTPVTGHVSLDWGVAQEKYGVAGRLLQHSGSNGNWFAVIGIVPECRCGVLVAANSAEDTGGDRATVEVLKAMIATLPQAPPPAPPPATPPPVAPPDTTAKK
jgi:CubicO group peptidase (beta-lactamase class C family)